MPYLQEQSSRGQRNLTSQEVSQRSGERSRVLGLALLETHLADQSSRLVAQTLARYRHKPSVPPTGGR